MFFILLYISKEFLTKDVKKWKLVALSDRSPFCVGNVGRSATRRRISLSKGGGRQPVNPLAHQSLVWPLAWFGPMGHAP